MYIYMFKGGGVFKSDEFHESVNFLECVYVGIGTIKEFVGGEWTEVEVISEDQINDL